MIAFFVALANAAPQGEKDAVIVSQNSNQEADGSYQYK